MLASLQRLTMIAKPLSLAALTLALSPSAAHAVVVSVAGNTYDITTETTSYLSSPSLFQLPPAGRMPWWGDGTGASASTFAQVVYNQLGAGPTPGYSPMFVYEISGGNLNAILQNLSDPLSQLDDIFADNLTVAFAVATPVSTPVSTASVPAPLPLAALATAAAWSRRLRRRIHSAS
jgi:hypothetical protein